jgi:predicted NBD/HSP70 family sugar kinase
MAIKGAGQLRETNRQRVLDAMLDYAGRPVTHAELARETSLAVGTISSIVRELADSGIVDTVAGAGRRGGTVRLGRGAGLVASVDFGHTHVAVALADMTGSVLAEARDTVETDQEHHLALARAAEMLDAQLLAQDADRALIRTIGLGLPVPLHHGKVMGSAIMPGWVGVNPREAAEQVFRLPVVVDNDANLGALAEHRLGAGRGYSDLVFVKISSGVGSGIILENRIFRGTDGIAGELGHLTLDDQGPLCRCGSRGCMEAYTATGTTLEMMTPHLPDATFDEVIAAAKAGNVAALRVFEDAGLHLGWGLAAVTNVLNPGAIIVGGDMARAGDLLLDSARVGLRRHVLAGSDTTPIFATELGDRASLLGGVHLAIDGTNLLAQ